MQGLSSVLGDWQAGALEPVANEEILLSACKSKIQTMSHEPTTYWLYSGTLLWNLLVHFIIHLGAPWHDMDAHDSASHAVKWCHTDSPDDLADPGQCADIAEQYILSAHTA